MPIQSSAAPRFVHEETSSAPCGASNDHVSFVPTLLDILCPEWTSSRTAAALSYQNFKYFQFFAFGALIRSEFAALERIMDSAAGRTVMILTPFLLLLLHHIGIAHWGFLIDWAFSLSAVLLVFLFFRSAGKVCEGKGRRGDGSRSPAAGAWTSISCISSSCPTCILSEPGSWKPVIRSWSSAQLFPSSSR